MGRVVMIGAGLAVVLLLSGRLVWAISTDDDTLLFHNTGESTKTSSQSDKRLKQEKKEKRKLAAEKARKTAANSAKPAPSPEAAPAPEIPPEPVPAPEASTTPTSYRDPYTGMEFILIKGGCFRMGDTFGDGESAENPRGEDTCVGDFYLAKFEVTQGEWSRLMKNESSFQKGDRYPVENVSWSQAQEYIDKLKKETGRQYRLPTEAEWEYAARSGGKAEKWAGTSLESALGEYAWYNGNAKGTPHEVGTKNPNGLGLHDMSGNVMEWTCSEFELSYNGSRETSCASSSSGAYRVFRGGCWINLPREVRAANRGGSPPRYRYDFLGFRLALPSIPNIDVAPKPSSQSDKRLEQEKEALAARLKEEEQARETAANSAKPAPVSGPVVTSSSSTRSTPSTLTFPASARVMKGSQFKHGETFSHIISITNNYDCNISIIKVTKSWSSPNGAVIQVEPRTGVFLSEATGSYTYELTPSYTLVPGAETTTTIIFRTNADIAYDVVESSTDIEFGQLVGGCKVPTKHVTVMSTIGVSADDK